MHRVGSLRRLALAAAALAAGAFTLAGPAAAAPEATPVIDPIAAARQLRTVATGNPEAVAALDRLLADTAAIAKAGEVALPAQPFQVPAQSDIGRGDGGSLYGNGIAFGYDGFRFAFFGGPGTIAPNQNDARLEVIWLNLATGESGTNQLIEHQDIPVDTTIRTAKLSTGAGTVVAAIYGSLWHRWPMPVSAEHPDGFAYQRGTVIMPTFGAVYN
ncbi:hypothetical protein [Nocardia asteroides]|uniref:hypothetical protein n=1 Tax=Nocardia asteroides TaxID=1824 RepID=UPI001E4D8211|nr:hypothetical protein [Nocardia asteroides]UGT64009.1 hypothetical protein LTT61_12175 [Nocardia asteroides]